MTTKQNQLHLIKTVFTHKQTTHFSILVTDDAVCKIRYNTCVNLVNSKTLSLIHMNFL